MSYYEFCFSVKKKNISEGEEYIYNNVVVNINVVIDNIKFITYYIDNNTVDEVKYGIRNDICVIEQATTILLISTGNSAHSICEIISFLNYYKNTNCKNTIAISEYVLELLPLLYELIKLFIDDDKVLLLNKNINYKFKTLITYRNFHFNYTKSWDTVKFSKNNNILKFDNIEYISHDFLLDTLFLFDKVKEIYDNFKDEFELFDNIMLIKTSNDTLSSSIHRAMDLPNQNTIDLLHQNNIKFLSIPYFKNIKHFICVLYHAKNAIFSYGGPCCTNRYFCNSKANVIVLAHLHYKPEYEYVYDEYDSDHQMYWHIRHSHLYPVKKQSFLLDFDNNINEDNINDILNLINA
jgi:hypothetical protein